MRYSRSLVSLGKTRAFLEAFKRLQDDIVVDRALIIAPKAICELTWRQEIEKWGYNFTVEFLWGSHKNEIIQRKADIYLINPEGVSWLFGRPNRTRRRWLPGAWADWQWKPDVLCFDELSTWKAANGERAKTVRRYLTQFPYRYGLTGTPAPNGYLDLHGQMVMIDRGAALDHRITHYRERYFMPPPGASQDDWRFHRKWVLQPGAKEQIEAAIAPRVTALEASDFIRLPDLVTTMVPVPLPDYARRAYDRMTTDGVLTVPECPDPFTAESPAAAQAKGRQISNGALYVQDELGYPTGEWALIHNAKLTALESLVGQIAGPVMIAYEFKHDLARLRELYPSARSLSAGQTGKERQEIVTAWNEGRVSILLLQPQAGGRGLNLQGGSNSIVWMTPPWDLELRIQTVGRLLRQGQSAANVFEYFLCGEGTSDWRVASVLSQKAELQQSLLDALRTELEEDFTA